MPSQPSALIVFELLQPYAPEITSVLALPTGFDVRFRFKKRWFATDDPSKLDSKTGLIALRITENTAILPLRFCTVTRVIDIGDIFYFVARLRDYVELSSGAQGQTQQLDSFNGSLRDGPLHRLKNEPGAGMEKLVFLGPSFESHFGNNLYSGSEENRQVSAWGTLVEILIKTDGFKKTNFLRVLSLDDGSPNSEQPTTANSSFRLAAERHYRLRVVQRRAEVQPVTDFVLTLDRTMLLPILAKQRAVGAYDILDFSFQTAPRKGYEQRTLMVLSAETGETAPSSPPLILPAFIPRQSQILSYISAVLFLVGATMLLFPSLVVQRLGVPAIPDEIKNAAIILMIVTSPAIGAIGSSMINKAYQLWK